ncbi:MAG: YraN family protein [Campylobacter sp.]|nr:YraN family protein [Campylobacter sp.]
MGLKEYIFGFNSEDEACKFLKKQGCEILHRNFHSRFGEIDIIAEKNEILHFIEVKASDKNYATIYRLTPQKMAKILKTIDFYFMKYKCQNDYQIDLITIENDEIKWLENLSL